MLAFHQVRGLPVHRTDTPEEVLEYLRDRGVSSALAARIGVKITSAAALISEARGGPQWAGDTRHAVIFPHYALGGEPLDWWSARLVGRAAQHAPQLRVVASFSDYVDAAQSPPSGLGKMFCPPAEPPAAYLPPSEAGLPHWDRIPRNSRVYIHESVIKALNGAVLGTYSVGLNGVWGWGSRKHAIPLVSELKSLPWKALNLQPVILFDSNIHSSSHVLEAAKRLATRLLELTGALTKLMRLPPPALDAPDYGFDDYVQSVGLDEARLFLEDTPLEDIEISEVELIKLELNSRVAVVESLGRVIDQATGTLMTRAVFTEMNYAHYMVDLERANGTLASVNVPKLWLADPRRTCVQALAYEPGQPLLIPRPQGKLDFNVWHGWGNLPTPGDVDRWLALLSYNVADSLLLDWVLDWLAWPLQHPGQKLTTLLLIFGPSGTGKDLFLRPLHRIYGHDNAVKISNDELRSSFTSLYAQKQFIHADELKRVRDAADQINQKIKGLVTSESLVVNRKGDPEYRVRNSANLVITSNYYDCIKLDEDDRRSCVVRWEPVTPMADHRGDQPYWLDYVGWVDSADGIGAIFNFLLTRDLSKFDPTAWAPTTSAKADVIDAARSPIEQFIAGLRTDPDLHLPPLVGARCLFTSRELAAFYCGAAPSPAQITILANELRNQNFHQANKNKPVRTKNGLARYYVVPRGTPEDKLAWDLPSVCSQHLRTHGLG